MGPINFNPALVQIMAWRRSADTPLAECIMVKFTDRYMYHTAPMSGIWQWDFRGLHINTNNIVYFGPFY